jgi:hypothetical protein
MVREAAMTGSLLLTLLFLGNVALFFLWVNYVIKVLRGHCPHCGR